MRVVAHACAILRHHIDNQWLFTGHGHHQRLQRDCSLLGARISMRRIEDAMIRAEFFRRSNRIGKFHISCHTNQRPCLTTHST